MDLLVIGAVLLFSHYLDLNKASLSQNGIPVQREISSEVETSLVKPIDGSKNKTNSVMPYKEKN